VQVARGAPRRTCILHAVGGTASERGAAAASLHRLCLCKAGGRHVRLQAACASVSAPAWMGPTITGITGDQGALLKRGGVGLQWATIG
jgi:hypothetical protein